MGTGTLSNEEIVAYYKQDVKKLCRYVSWLESKSGQQMHSNYGADGIATNSISFPVYDGTLMNFIKEAQTTCFMDRNYVYVYSRNGLKTSRDEMCLIQRATIRDMDKLAGILSRYVLGGRTKGKLWSEGVQNGVYVAILKKMQGLIEFWEGNMVEKQ